MRFSCLSSLDLCLTGCVHSVQGCCMSFWWATLHSNVYPCIFILSECYSSSNTFYNSDGTENLYCAYSVALSAVCSLLQLLILHSAEAWQGRQEWEGGVESTCCQYMSTWACGHACMRAVFVLCCVRLKLVLKGEIKPAVCFSFVSFSFVSFSIV